eukprot:jgi/Undpi1/11580/HiC_scaffold_30.g13875.m1
MVAGSAGFSAVRGAAEYLPKNNDAQISDVTETISKAFVEYNTSIGAHAEMLAGDFGDARTASMVVSWFCKTHEGYTASDGDKIVGSTFVDVAAKGSKVASLGPVSSVSPGAGKKTFESCCAHAEGLGFSTLVLMQIASSSRSFALFAKLGFEAKHACQYIGGFMPAAESSHPTEDAGGPSLAPMTEGDVQECADLFVRAHGADNGWDRKADIGRMLATAFPFVISGVVYEYPHVGSLDSSLTVGSIAVVCYGCARVSAKVSRSHGVPWAAIVGSGAKTDDIPSHHHHGQGNLRARLARFWVGRDSKRDWMVKR